MLSWATNLKRYMNKINLYKYNSIKKTKTENTGTKKPSQR